MATLLQIPGGIKLEHVTLDDIMSDIPDLGPLSPLTDCSSDDPMNYDLQPFSDVSFADHLIELAKPSTSHKDEQLDDFYQLFLLPPACQTTLTSTMDSLMMNETMAGYRGNQYYDDTEDAVLSRQMCAISEVEGSLADSGDDSNDYVTLYDSEGRPAVGIFNHQFDGDIDTKPSLTIVPVNNNEPLRLRVAPKTAKKSPRKSLKVQSDRAGGKRYHCYVCDREFSNKSNYQQHYRTHTGEKPYSCDFCAKSFAQPSTLNTHVRIHTKEKPFACDSCPRRFGDYSTLAKHKRTHTGNRPYVCDVCDRAFTQSGNLLRHKRNHNK